MSSANVNFFGATFLDVLTGHISPDQTSSEVDYIEESLGLAGPSTLLDVGCGGGRHSIELARRGHRVTAVEASAEAIKRARSAANEAGVEVDFVHGSNLALESLGRILDGTFDGAISWQTSLGIYRDAGGDIATLQHVSNLLRVGAKFVLETTSLPWLIRNFVSQDWRETGGALVFERRTMDLVAQVIRTEASVLVGGRLLDRLTLELRMYTCVEILSMLEAAGLTVTSAEGSMAGEPYNLSSRRLLVNAQK